jgi:hypothetical protein
MQSDFITYFKSSDNEYITYDNETGQYETMERLTKECNKFEILNKKFTLDNEGLKLYAGALVKANDEIKNSKLLPFKYCIFDNEIRNKKTKVTSTIYRSSATMALTFFKRLTPKSTYAMLDPLTPDEVKLSNLCINTGIYHCSKDIEIENAFSYDYRLYYPSLLASENFFFPCKPGHYIEFTDIDMTNLKIDYGYYHCQIAIKNENCKKVFMFNKNNYYTHYDLLIALKLHKQYGSVEITPLGKAEDELVCGHDIFNYVKLLKEKFPKNIIVKLLSSSLWGYLVQENTFKCYEMQMQKGYD